MLYRLHKRHAAACPVADVVVHFTIVHQRAFPFVVVATVLLVPCRGFDVVFLEISGSTASRVSAWLHSMISPRVRVRPFQLGTPL